MLFLYPAKCSIFSELLFTVLIILLTTRFAAFCRADPCSRRLLGVLLCVLWWMLRVRCGACVLRCTVVHERGTRCGACVVGLCSYFSFDYPLDFRFLGIGPAVATEA